MQGFSLHVHKKQMKAPFLPELFHEHLFHLTVYWCVFFLQLSCSLVDWMLSCILS